MRSFIACEISHPGIEKVIDEIRKTGADIKYVEPENTHITLKFLGDITEEMARRVSAAIRSSIQPPKMKARLSGVGVFPGMNYMRVLWIGMYCPQIENLQHKIDLDLSELGFRRDKKFKPHLTIGRIRSARNKRALRDAVERMSDIEIGEVIIDKVKLKKSELSPKGPRYSDIEVFKL